MNAEEIRRKISRDIKLVGCALAFAGFHDPLPDRPLGSPALRSASSPC
jgi:hypothetical protein